MKANHFFYVFFTGCFWITACKNNTTVNTSAESLHSSTGLWKSTPVKLPNELNISSYNSYLLDTIKLKSILSQVTSRDPNNSSVVLELPNPDTTFSNWNLAITNTMSDELMAKYPELKTFQGIQNDHPKNTVRLEWTGQGFTAMLKKENSSIVIQPLPGSKTNYICYYSSNISVTKKFNETSQPK